MQQIAQKFTFACATARKAGVLAKNYFSNLAALTIHSKGVQDMASEADVNTENLIRSAIAAEYPHDAFLGEETYKEYRLDPAKGTWVVDPIDGTHPFVSGIPSWCIVIAYVENNITEIGVIYDPV
ncbi:MAG TPA: inositol monophosphatase, partial [Gammaproteobacteria bacterium]